MNIADRILDIQNALATVAKNVNGLRAMEAKLTRLAGGALPKRLMADLEALEEMDAAEMSDEDFIKRLAEVADSRDPIKGLMNLATLAARLKAAEKRLSARAEKLRVRAVSSGADAEGDSAAALKARLVAAQKLTNARIGLVIARFFELRLYAINAELKLTEQIYKLLKSDAEELRGAALKSSAAQAIEALGAFERLVTKGNVCVGSSTGKGSVKI